MNGTVNDAKSCKTSGNVKALSAYFRLDCIH